GLDRRNQTVGIGLRAEHQDSGLAILRTDTFNQSETSQLISGQRQIDYYDIRLMFEKSRIATVRIGSSNEIPETKCLKHRTASLCNDRVAVDHENAAQCFAPLLTPDHPIL